MYNIHFSTNEDSETYFTLNYNYSTAEVDGDATWMLKHGCTELAHKSTVMGEYLNLITCQTIACYKLSIKASMRKCL